MQWDFWANIQTDSMENSQKLKLYCQIWRTCRCVRTEAVQVNKDPPSSHLKAINDQISEAAADVALDWCPRRRESPPQPRNSHFLLVFQEHFSTSAAALSLGTIPPRAADKGGRIPAQGDAFGCRRNMNHHFDSADRHLLSVRGCGSALAPLRAHTHGGRGRGARLHIWSQSRRWRRAFAGAAMAAGIERCGSAGAGEGLGGWVRGGMGFSSLLFSAQTRRAAPPSCDIFFPRRRWSRRSKIKKWFKKWNSEAVTRESVLGLFECWLELEGILCGSMIHLASSHF